MTKTYLERDKNGEIVLKEIRDSACGPQQVCLQRDENGETVLKDVQDIDWGAVQDKLDRTYRQEELQQWLDGEDPPRTAPDDTPRWWPVVKLILLIPLLPVVLPMLIPVRGNVLLAALLVAAILVSLPPVALCVLAIYLVLLFAFFLGYQR